MDNHCVWLKTTVSVGCELCVLEADVLSLLQVVTICATVGAFESATVVVSSAMLSTLAWISLASGHRALRSASVAVRFVLLIREADFFRFSHFVAIRTAGASIQSAAILVGCTMGLAFRFVMLKVLRVVLTIFNAAGASVLCIPMRTALRCVLLELHGKAISAENLPDFTTAIVVHLLLAVLATSRGDTLLIGIVIVTS